jgi:putative pyruvate formate lyase activating enzyme
VFFNGCNLRCIFCQNHDIAHQKNGFSISPEELAERYIKLQYVGKVHDTNRVTQSTLSCKWCSLFYTRRHSA